VAKFLSGHFTQYVDYDFTAKLEDELDAVSRGEEDWVPLMRKFWTPFKSLVTEKTETVDRAEATGARELGLDPASGKPISVRLGRYGPMAQIGTKDDAEKPRFASLRPGQSIHTITLEDALHLFKLPRELGTAADGETISVGIGRFGPFVKHGKVYASIKPPDDPYTVELPRANEILREKEEAIRNRVIASFQDGAIQILRGQYGPYITDGKKNARIPKDREPASLTEAECAQLLAAAPEKRGRFGKAAKTATAKTAKAEAEAAPAKKAVAKKTAAKKATKKTAAKKAARKKPVAP
jgi:DNA topoisomerase-1